MQIYVYTINAYTYISLFFISQSITIKKAHPAKMGLFNSNLYFISSHANHRRNGIIRILLTSENFL
jgi:hypothetical protein